jgi:hypothetical protein
VALKFKPPLLIAKSYLGYFEVTNTAPIS